LLFKHPELNCDMERSMNSVDEIAAADHVSASLLIGTLMRFVRARGRLRRFCRDNTNAGIRAAIARADADALRKGLGHGADPAGVSRWRRNNAFHILARNPTVSTLGVLLEWGIGDHLNRDVLRESLRAPDSAGLSPMHVLQFNLGQAIAANDSKTESLFAHAYRSLSPYAGDLTTLVDHASRCPADMKAVGRNAYARALRLGNDRGMSHVASRPVNVVPFRKER
jgi:hypothetical protein